MSTFLREVPLKGLGLFAGRYFRAGELVTPMRGVRVHHKEVEERHKRFAFRADASHVIVPDTEEKTPAWWFANQSCAPNATLSSVGIVALVPIPEGEEVTVFYAWHDTNYDSCYCGNEPCFLDLAFRVKTSFTQTVERFLRVAVAHDNVQAIEFLTEAYPERAALLPQVLKETFGTSTHYRMRELSANRKRLIRRAREQNPEARAVADRLGIRVEK